MLWRLAAMHSSGAVDMWHVIFAVASFCAAVSCQWGASRVAHRGSPQGGAHGFGVKVTKKWDDSLFEPSDVDASGARCGLRVGVCKNFICACSCAGQAFAAIVY
jgi:hypothetical protein